VLAPVAVRVQLRQEMNVAVVVRRALDDLAVLVPVAARDLVKAAEQRDRRPVRQLRATVGRLGADLSGSQRTVAKYDSLASTRPLPLNGVTPFPLTPDG
jgi:hypothetical protein